uniref:Wsv419-like protein n=1 Tax=Sicyonia whispovirus TaxID=2984283 RepID=A0A9C7BN48_9VIRU|nr:MAG: wsv419-like protein [Sicyonia whispovirus]
MPLDGEPQQAVGRAVGPLKLEVLPGRLLPPEVFPWEDTEANRSLLEHLRLYREKTSERAAAVLLSGLLEYYRRPLPALYREFAIVLAAADPVWRRLFPGGSLTSAMIAGTPWTVPTVFELVDAAAEYPSGWAPAGEQFGHEMAARDLALEEPCAMAGPASHSTNKYPRAPTVVCVREATERSASLLLTCRRMLEVIRHGGKL